MKHSIPGRYCHMQDTYAKKMKQFGLERGETGTLLSHKQISRYYNEIKKVIEAKMPEPGKDESIEDYKNRCDDSASHQRSGEP